MIAAELRGGNKPSLNEALGWIGSRVDDIYGAGVGRLEDVWIDPGTGAPRWLLVKEGRFGGRTTLIPFEDATAGAGHIWVPYERDVVRQAPEIEPGAPLTHQVEASLRSHYAANSPQSISDLPRPEAPAPREQRTGLGSATVRLHDRQPGQQPPEPTGSPYELPARPAPPIAAPPARPEEPPQQQQPAYPPQQPQHYAPPPAQPYPQPQAYQQPQAPAYPPQQPQQPPPGWGGQPAWAQAPQPPQPDPLSSLRDLAAAPGTHYVEIELAGELTIRGELRSIRVVPRP